ncbi:alpha-L-fucosidase [Gemmatimonadota bacterium]
MPVLSALVFLFTAGCFVAACSGTGPQTEKDRRMAWWREARFGLFIHWGLYAIPAGQWGEETNHAEWIMTTAEIPVEEYERFVGRFNPVQFDADAWVSTAKRAGMKYIVITTKHHDGFALFDSAVSDYDVMATPFGRDVMAELAEACRRHGLEIGWYHSIMDWHHPDYLPRRAWETRSAEGADLDRFVDYLRAQVTELLTDYGPIGVMWFDGEWESTWNHEYGQPLYDLCLELQPDVIVNNRVDVYRGGMAGLTTDEQAAGDFGTPEQQIPATGLPGMDWETCMTMNDHWGYNSSDLNYKSPRLLIQMLVDIASKGGNFLLNVGPTAEGLFPPQSIERLEAIGAWMDVNGEAIYGTTASPFTNLPWGRCTVKQQGRRTDLFLHVFDWPADGSLIVPGIGNRPVRAWLLSDDSQRVDVTRDGTDLRLDLPPTAPDAICSVVVLEVRGAPVVYEAPEIEAEVPILVHPLLVEMHTRSEELTIRYTTDGTDPTVDSPAYTGPVLLETSGVVKARSFHGRQPVSTVSEATFAKVDPLASQPAEGLAAGLEMAVFHGDWDALPDFDGLRPVTVERVDNVRLTAGPRVEFVGRRYSGYLDIPRDDVYRFRLISDDGSRLLIDGESVVDNDGLHGAEARQGYAALAEGSHRIVVEWFNKTGGAELGLLYAPVGEAFVPIPQERLKHRP